MVAIDSGVGLANATMQLRLVAVRLFYDQLVEEGVRETNPVGRGRYTPGRGFGGHRERGLIPRFTKLPWIPSDEQWRQRLHATRPEPLRNCVMLALAYAAGLRSRSGLRQPTRTSPSPAGKVCWHRQQFFFRGARVLPSYLQVG